MRPVEKFTAISSWVTKRSISSPGLNFQRIQLLGMYCLLVAAIYLDYFWFCTIFQYVSFLDIYLSLIILCYIFFMKLFLLKLIYNIVGSSSNDLLQVQIIQFKDLIKIKNIQTQSRLLRAQRAAASMEVVAFLYTIFTSTLYLVLSARNCCASRSSSSCTPGVVMIYFEVEFIVVAWIAKKERGIRYFSRCTS